MIALRGDRTAIQNKVFIGRRNKQLMAKLKFLNLCCKARMALEDSLTASFNGSTHMDGTNRDHPLMLEIVQHLSKAKTYILEAETISIKNGGSKVGEKKDCVINDHDSKVAKQILDSIHRQIRKQSIDVCSKAYRDGNSNIARRGH